MDIHSSLPGSTPGYAPPYNPGMERDVESLLEKTKVNNICSNIFGGMFIQKAKSGCIGKMIWSVIIMASSFVLGPLMAIEGLFRAIIALPLVLFGKCGREAAAKLTKGNLGCVICGPFAPIITPFSLCC